MTDTTKPRIDLSTLEQAALHLLQKLSVPNGAVSISSFRDKNGDVIIRVFLLPEFKYLKPMVPSHWDGFNVICETSPLPTLESLFKHDSNFDVWLQQYKQVNHEQ